MREIRIEGYTADDILRLDEDLMTGFVLTGEPIAFTAGTAQILGSFRIMDHTLVVELAHIDGGGEGVLPLLSSLIERYARKRNLSAVEWIVHAVSCAKPNPKLRRVLRARGFQIEVLPSVGEAYHLVQTLVSGAPGNA